MSAPAPAPKKKKENIFINLICNIAVPSLVLMYLSTPEWLGPQWGMIVALAFPLGYGVYDLLQRKKFNFFSIIGILSVLMTGVLNELKVELFWYAVKEAAMPSLLGLSVLASMGTKRPVVRELIWNDQAIDTEKVERVLNERGLRADFERLLRNASFGVAASFLLSAILNYGLARYLLKSPPGTVEFNAEFGKMGALSWPVISLPTLIVFLIVFWRLISGITRLTGMPLEEIMHGGAEKKPDAP
ncbi:MAG TPA: VC0807 family protein [Opitutaceae bacterium]